MTGAAVPTGADGAPDAPVGFVSGAIDLLYRDPRSGELVVVDYKTDAVTGEDELRERARAYGLQGRRYTEALRDALALPRIPRFELWFLYPGRVVDAS
jgi:ATP-dependent exoDNAse (exonuclease V) beta subunit